MATTFIGIDLAWKSDRNPTGVAVLTGAATGADLTELGTLQLDSSVFDFVRVKSTENTVVAIDAPLVITNLSGQRLCETEVGRRYGGRHAACHTTNLTLYKNAASVVLTSHLISAGFVHLDLNNPPKQRGRFIAEVYPHAAMVALWDLPTIIKYKKGAIGQRVVGLEELRLRLKGLSNAEPQLVETALMSAELSWPLHGLGGKQLKDHEDRLDALFCAYLAYFFWYWGSERSECFGDCVTGYIMNPKLEPRAR